MRPIDADDLKKTYYRELNIEPGETGACYIAFGMLPRMIDNARTINIEKPKRGRWIKEYNGNGWNDYWDYTCSVCEKTLKRGEPYPYCPNCGAKMEDGNE